MAALNTRIAVCLAVGAVVVCVAVCLLARGTRCAGSEQQGQRRLRCWCLFLYACFLKPLSGGRAREQQDALESFYSRQAGAYDATRTVLLRGREDMLALAAAQLRHRAKGARSAGRQNKIWVDVGGGTGFNIEAMARFVHVASYFSSVYLVDLSPSLCEVARKRFARLGWSNVKVICQDARLFRLEDHEPGLASPKSSAEERAGGAHLVTISYSLSMIPDYYAVIDSLPSLLAPGGIVAVVDFYVQSNVDVAFRNYTGGLIGRHVNVLARNFWRAWFDLDRVGLEPARRDYLEYSFGTVLNVNCRNHLLGAIPYYIWLGTHKRPARARAVLEELDARLTESACAAQRSASDIRSKAFDTAVLNLASDLPLPSAFYQNHHWRVHYDDQLQKHTQFGQQYIYAFTWEDSRVDERVLKIGPDDVVLAITSAGDNVLSYALQGPASIHAVDLNPCQNHLLELKLAAFSSLPYADFWKLFGEGKHPAFRSLLLSNMSPHLSSRAFQYWLRHQHVFTSRRGAGLYDTGRSKHAIRIFRCITRLFGCHSSVNALLSAKTLHEQVEIWRATIRPALLSRLVARLVVSQEAFLWTALGVPKNQLAMIEADQATSPAEADRGPEPDPTVAAAGSRSRSRAVWQYMASTLDPVVEQTHIATENPYYHVCLAGRFAPGCRLDYQSARAHARLSRPRALDALRIHTDDLHAVLARLAPATLTVVVLMDSMDWFDPPPGAPCPGPDPDPDAGPGPDAAAAQIRRLNRAMRLRGRVLLRSAARRPWYLDRFRSLGFEPCRVGPERTPGVCLDRVNMYASCWVCTKVRDLEPPSSPPPPQPVGVVVRESGTA